MPGSEGTQEPRKYLSLQPTFTGSCSIESLVIPMLPHTQVSVWDGRKESLVSTVKEMWAQVLAFTFSSWRAWLSQDVHF